MHRNLTLVTLFENRLWNRSDQTCIWGMFYQKVYLTLVFTLVVLPCIAFLSKICLSLFMQYLFLYLFLYSFHMYSFIYSICIPLFISYLFLYSFHICSFVYSIFIPLFMPYLSQFYGYCHLCCSNIGGGYSSSRWETTPGGLDEGGCSCHADGKLSVLIYIWYTFGLNTFLYTTHLV